MNLPNALTLSRILLAFAAVFLLNERSSLGNILALIVFGVASLTDFYDGHFAKSRAMVSDFGKIMDPVADKILLLSVLGVLAHLKVVAWWMFVVIAAREVLVTYFRIRALGQGEVLAAERAGKIKTVAQIIAVSVILLYLAAQSYGFLQAQNVQAAWLKLNYGLMLVVVILTIYSGLDFFYQKAK
jgi:CDP-diacylglycerol--glycerol-3-phosphate 3-phosphatidyltransferase